MTELNDRNDPRPGEPYGSCETCGITLPDKKQADDHMSATFATSSSAQMHSHTINVTNPERMTRVANQIGCIVSDAIESALDQINQAVRRGDMSKEETHDALRFYGDFRDAWDDDQLDIDEEND